MNKIECLYCMLGYCQAELNKSEAMAEMDIERRWDSFSVSFADSIILLDIRWRIIQEMYVLDNQQT